ncbi:MAG: DUF3108 domain-containing protein [Acidobacteria bacterium]|nr:DUF3108 domain-containing protein [Acidobacteriota bacterium]
MRLVLALLACVVLRGQQPETLSYGVEWRFVRAGEVQLKYTGDRQSDLTLKSVGLVSSFLKVDDTYRAQYDQGWCATSLNLEAHEGKRNRETKVTFDRARKRSSYLEKDMTSGATVLAKEMEIPACVHEPSGGLQRMRHLKLAAGAATELPVSDGKRLAMVKVEAQGVETVKTPMGEFRAMKYEAFMFNGVIYARKGRLFVWVTEDEKRLPVQIRVQLPFYVGNMTLQLEKVQ